jgi:hypothetical protein
VKSRTNVRLSEPIAFYRRMDRQLRTDAMEVRRS